MIRYRCLILDHDDTTVESTASIHYPAHLEVMRRLRPDAVPISLDEWFLKNFDPGIMEYMREELDFDDEEIERELEIWREFTTTRTPPFFPGLPTLLEEYVGDGGLLAVASHSEAEQIRRHYRENGVKVVPTYVHGWENDESKRKPHPWPVRQILEESGVGTEDVLVVDDLRPGVEMARSAGVAVAAAGWGHDVPSINTRMREMCDYWLPEVEDLRRLLWS